MYMYTEYVLKSCNQQFVGPPYEAQRNGLAPLLQAGYLVPAGWFPVQTGSPILLKTLEIK